MARQKNSGFLLDYDWGICTIYIVSNGLFSVPAPLGDLLAGDSAGFFCALFAHQPQLGLGEEVIRPCGC